MPTLHRHSPARASGLEVSAAPPRLAPWSGTLTCYTAALGEWAARRRRRWWRLLVAGGPTLSVLPRGLHLEFRHSRVSPAVALGLRLRTAPSWAEAEPAIADELERSGRVVVAADAWALPWHPAHRRSHVSHWVLVERQGDALELHDSLAMDSEFGRLRPSRVLVRQEAETILRSELRLSGPERLREAAALGSAEVEDGAAYRWLVADPAARPPSADATAPDDTEQALTSLADYFERHAGRAHAYEHLLDVWQAARQRALVVAALEAEGGRAADAVADWRALANEWAALPPLLLHAGMLAASGTTAASAHGVVERLRRLTEAESRLRDRRFPELDDEAA